MMELGPYYEIQLNAVDPTTGTTVTGVTISAIAITGDALGASALATQVGPFMLTPGPGATV